MKHRHTSRRRDQAPAFMALAAAAALVGLHQEKVWQIAPADARQGAAGRRVIRRQWVAAYLEQHPYEARVAAAVRVGQELAHRIAASSPLGAILERLPSQSVALLDDLIACRRPYIAARALIRPGPRSLERYVVYCCSYGYDLSTGYYREHLPSIEVVLAQLPDLVARCQEQGLSRDETVAILHRIEAAARARWYEYAFATLHECLTVPHPRAAKELWCLEHLEEAAALIVARSVEKRLEEVRRLETPSYPVSSYARGG